MGETKANGIHCLKSGHKFNKVVQPIAVSLG